MCRLDKNFLDLLTSGNVRIEFDNLKRAKFDVAKNKVRITPGCDCVNHTRFEEHIDRNSHDICNFGRKGQYRFKPFMEKETPKPPFGRHEFERARKAKKMRTLSISTIRDTIFQKLLCKPIDKHAESMFRKYIDENSYGYRKGKSSKGAVKKIRRYIKDGYVHILDGDIEQFFDKIDHTLLEQKMSDFFGEENKLVQRYLRKFMRVDKIPVGGSDAYKNDKTQIKKRTIGIPQGGVLSGLLANVFLFDFDLFVTQDLMSTYEFKYLRYADDFVLMFKDDRHIVEVFGLLEKYLANEKLTLHPLPTGQRESNRKYSEKLNLSAAGKESLDFLGFEISSRFLQVKDDNLKKFKKKIVKIVNDSYDKWIKNNQPLFLPAFFTDVVNEINKKITGLEDSIEHEDGLCPHCKKLIAKRSWIGYFMMIDDVRQLRNIDRTIRAEIARSYRIKSNGHHLTRKEFSKYTHRLKSVVDTYYVYKKQIKRHRKNGYCCYDKHRYYDESKQLLVTPPHGKDA